MWITLNIHFHERFHASFLLPFMHLKRNGIASPSFCLSSFFPVSQCARICVVFVLTGCPVLKLIGDINVTECHQHKNQPSVLKSRHSVAHICYGTGANLMWCTSPPLKGHVIPHHVWQEPSTQKQNVLKDKIHTVAEEICKTFSINYLHFQVFIKHSVDIKCAGGKSMWTLEFNISLTLLWQQ